MQTRWFSILLGSALGLTLFVGNTPETFAQKGGGGKGGGHSSGGHAGSVHSSGGHPGGSGYHGNHNVHHGGHYGYGGVGFGIGIGGVYPRNYAANYGIGYSPYYLPYTTNNYLPLTSVPPIGAYQSFYLPPADNAPASGPAVLVNVNEGGFSSGQLEITTGTTVRWTNTGQHGHGLAQPTLDWKSPSFSTGKTYSWTFNEPGMYELEDASNPNAKMIILVK